MDPDIRQAVGRLGRAGGVMKVTVTVNGQEQAIRSIIEAPERLKEGAQAALEMAGQVLVRQSLLGSANGKSGKQYRNLPNRSSAPGEYPANQSGAHLNSVDYTVEPWRMTHGAGAGHSGFLEDGTSKMAPRPTLGNAFRDSQGRLYDIFAMEPFKRLSQ